jgi:hypothetical protein
MFGTIAYETEAATVGDSLDLVNDWCGRCRWVRWPYPESIKGPSITIAPFAAVKVLGKRCAGKLLSAEARERVPANSAFGCDRPVGTIFERNHTAKCSAHCLSAVHGEKDAMLKRAWLDKVRVVVGSTVVVLVMVLRRCRRVFGRRTGNEWDAAKDGRDRWLHQWI